MTLCMVVGAPMHHDAYGDLRWLLRFVRRSHDRLLDGYGCICSLWFFFSSIILIASE